MPVTVKLSERFYQKFGHDLVDEMVNWFNEIDATYRGDLRELNELNFARFDAKLEQRVAQLDAKLDQRVTQLDAKLEQGLAAVRADVARLDGKLEQRLAQSDAKLEHRLAGLRDELHAQGRMLMHWMVGLWMTAIGLLSGLIFAALHFLPAARP